MVQLEKEEEEEEVFVLGERQEKTKAKIYLSKQEGGFF